MKLSQVILRGTRSAQPAAATSNTGFLYFVTDEGVTERSSGTAWESYSGSSGGGTPAGTDTQIQFSISGAFAADSNFTFDPALGGAFTLTTHDGDTDSQGGDILITAGNGNGTGGGGSLVVVAGDGTDAGDAGGIILIAGSAEAGNNNGGDIHLSAGAGFGSGFNGAFKFGDANGNFFWSGLQPQAYAGTISLDVSIQNKRSILTDEGTGDCIINASSGGVPSKEILLIITNDADSAKTITFGTNFKTAGPIVGTIDATAIIAFVSDGNFWYEKYRSLGLA